MNIIDELEKLKKERSVSAPFESLEEFEKWSDAVLPLLVFSERLSSEFSQSVTNATVTARMGSPEDAKTNMNNAISVLNQAIVSAKLNHQKPSETHKLVETLAHKKSIKEQFESHPVIWGLSLLFFGSIAGYGFNETITAKAQTPKPQLEITAPKEVGCKIEGLGKLTESHHVRVAALQAQLMKHESGASDGTLLPSYRQENKDSAERIRRDIITENEVFNENVANLDKGCQ